MILTKKELKVELEEMGFELSDDMNKADLLKMYKSAKETIPDSDLEEEVIEEEEVGRQASLSECIRQLTGKKPYEGSDLNSEVE